MAILVLLVLAALWAAVLIPPVVRARNGRAAAGAGGGSAYRLDVLRPASRPSSGPSRRSMPGFSGVSGAGMTRSQRRRRDILIGLGGAAVVTFVLAVVTGVAALWVLQLLADVLLVGYILLLVQIKNGGFGVPGRGPAARTIRAVPHRSPLAPVGPPARARRPVSDEPYIPAAYGASAARPPVRVPRYRSA